MNSNVTVERFKTEQTRITGFSSEVPPWLKENQNIILTSDLVASPKQISLEARKFCRGGSPQNHLLLISNLH